ncbi:hypothetical protein [Rhodococcoides kyotonense]
MEAFVRSIRAGDAPSPSFDDGVAALVLANAAVESAQFGRPVSVDI